MLEERKVGPNWPDEVIEALEKHQFSAVFCSDMLAKAYAGKDFNELTANQQRACYNWARR